ECCNKDLKIFSLNERLMNTKHMSQPNDDRDTGRIEAFSDGVIAVAITLLILDVHVPDVQTGLLQALLSQSPTYLGYVTSFLVITIFWPTITICSGISTRSITLYCSSTLSSSCALLLFPLPPQCSRSISRAQQINIRQQSSMVRRSS